MHAGTGRVNEGKSKTGFEAVSSWWLLLLLLIAMGAAGFHWVAFAPVTEPPVAVAGADKEIVEGISKAVPVSRESSCILPVRSAVPFLSSRSLEVSCSVTNRRPNAVAYQVAVDKADGVRLKTIVTR